MTKYIFVTGGVVSGLGKGITTPDALLKLVRDAVCAAWRRRGDEGSTGSTAGGQSYTYEDIEATLHKNICLLYTSVTGILSP